VLQRWRVHLKEHPHFALHAARWSEDAVITIQDWDPSDIQGIILVLLIQYIFPFCTVYIFLIFLLLLNFVLTGIQDQCAELLKIFTAARSEDLWAMECINVTQVAQTKTNSRSFKLVMNQTKNDKEGTGPVEGRTNYLACQCTTWTTNPKEKKILVKMFAESPDAPCPHPCPYSSMVRYMSLIPDPSGKLHQAKGSTAPPLKLFRAVVCGPNPYFNASPKGRNYFNEATKRVEAMLPEVERPGNTGRAATGHTGMYFSLFFIVFLFVVVFIILSSLISNRSAHTLFNCNGRWSRCGHSPKNHAPQGREHAGDYL
jgi:hypothetical protein